MDNSNNRENNRRNDRRDRRDRGGNDRRPRFERNVVSIRRVAKVTAGGRRLRFSAMVVVGDKNGSVGVGLGRGMDTRAAIEKGARIAEKSMIKVQLVGDTIPHEITHKKGAAKIMLRPAKLGTGVIAGSAARTVLESAGIENVYAKLLGTSDLIANTYATFEALKLLRNKRVLAKMKKMKERVGIKAEMDKERKEAEARKRKAEAKKRHEQESRERKAKSDARKSKRSPKKVEAPKAEVKAEVKTEAEKEEK